MATDLPFTTNLWAHYRPDLLGLGDSVAVSALPNQEGTSARDMAQATGADQPLHRTNRTPSGKPALVFDGVTEAMAAGAAITLKPCTLFAVIKLTATTPAIEQTVLGSSAGGGGQWRVATDFDVEWMEQGVQRIGTSTDAAKRVVANTWCVLSLTYGSAGAFEFFKDGASSGSGTLDTTLSSGNPHLARYGVTGGFAEFFTGEIADLAIFSAVLGSTDRASIESFLNTKYLVSGTPHTRTIGRTITRTF